MAVYPENEDLPVANRPETILGVTITFFGVACVAVLLRLYARFRSALWGWDDLLVVLASALVAVGAIFVCLLPGDGLGKHFWTLSHENIVSYFKHVWATNLFYTAGTALIKLAILVQYLRLFKGQHPLARRLTYGLITVTALWGTAFTLLAIFSCRPIRKNWDYLLPGTCVSWGSKVPSQFYATWMGHAVSNMMLDILTLICPLPFVRSLRMTGRTKVGLIALVSMGGTVVTISIARVISLSIRRAGTVPVLDMTYVTPTVYILSVLEINVAILTASVPIFWPYVTTLSMNKILIVNEIEIRTERRTSDFALIEQAKGPEGFVSVDRDMGSAKDDSRPSRTTAPGAAPTPKRSGSRFTRASHKQKRSSASSSKAYTRDIMPPRASHDSERNLQLSHHSSKNSFSSTSPDAEECALQTCTDNTRARYKDKYEQDWAVPDFDKSAPGGGQRPTYTTTVERAEIPYDHIRAFEK